MKLEFVNELKGRGGADGDMVAVGKPAEGLEMLMVMFGAVAADGCDDDDDDDGVTCVVVMRGPMSWTGTRDGSTAAEANKM